MRYLSLAILSVTLLSTSCSGSIGANTNTSGTSSVAAALTCTADKHSPGPAPIRRLTKREYINSIADIFGVDVSSMAEEFPLDPVMKGFRNNATLLTISVDQAATYQSIAEYVAEQVLSSPDKLAELTGGCNVAEQSCQEQAARSLGRKVYRRPLREDEQHNDLAPLIALGQTHDPADANGAIRLIIEGMLQSSRFLFRTELGENNTERPDLLKITGYEMASRLSFMLWQSSPDDALLDAAEAGELDTKEGVTSYAEQMLADERAKNSMHVFADQWLRLPLADNATPGEVDIDPTLKSAAHEEASRLIEDFLWNETDAIGLFNASYGYVDSTLANQYGLSGVGASGFEKTELVASGRGGFFGTASFLIMSAPVGKPPVVHRGKYIRDVVLCDPPPPVPADLQVSPEADRLADPVCAGCHTMMDPIGNGLEMFDQLAQKRDAYPDDSPLPGAGYIDGFDEPDFQNVAELGSKLAAAPETPACMVEYFFHWSLGRLQDTVADSCTLDALNADFENSGHNFKDLIRNFVQTDAFRFRIPIE
ncbi:MAG: DUF1592 domain-containing protein [Myxococcales bacterium]|nr:MAG: DUF1592 domain-containing protein [Myxococcales bacterium]